MIAAELTSVWETPTLRVARPEIDETRFWVAVVAKVETVGKAVVSEAWVAADKKALNSPFAFREKTIPALQWEVGAVWAQKNHWGLNVSTLYSTTKSPDTFLGLNWLKPVLNPPWFIQGDARDDCVKVWLRARKVKMIRSPTSALTSIGRKARSPFAPTITWCVLVGDGVAVGKQQGAVETRLGTFSISTELFVFQWISHFGLSDSQYKRESIVKFLLWIA